MPLFLVQSTWVMPWGERLLISLPIIVAAISARWTILPLAQQQYRESRQQRLPARLAWIAFGVGIALLAGAMVAVGICGLLGFVGFLANIFLVIAIACGAMGILLIVLFTILAIEDSIHRWSHPGNQKRQEDR